MCTYVISVYAANYDGTDIGRPYLVDNSTGTLVYTYLDSENYHPPSNRSKRGATAHKDHLWPQGVVPCSLYSDLTGIHVAGYIVFVYGMGLNTM